MIDNTPGTCQLASGYWAEHAEFSINHIPSDIRDMFEEAMLCLDNAHEGGFVTKHFARTIDWMLAPDTYFPQNPRELYMRKYIARTFRNAPIPRLSQREGRSRS